MSHRNYIPFRCLTSNILKENWLSYFLLPLLVMCKKTIPGSLQAASRSQVSGLVTKFVSKLSGLADVPADKQPSSVCFVPQAMTGLPHGGTCAESRAPLLHACNPQYTFSKVLTVPCVRPANDGTGPAKEEQAREGFLMYDGQKARSH